MRRWRSSPLLLYFRFPQGWRVIPGSTLPFLLAEMMKKRRGEVFYARPEFCTDNGAMIAYAGMVRFKAGATADLGVSVRPRWPLAELPAA